MGQPWLGYDPVDYECEMSRGGYRKYEERFWTGYPATPFAFDTIHRAIESLYGWIKFTHFPYIFRCLFTLGFSSYVSTQSTVFIASKYRINQECINNSGGSNLLDEDNDRRIHDAPNEFYVYTTGKVIETPYGVVINTARHSVSKGIVIKDKSDYPVQWKMACATKNVKESDYLLNSVRIYRGIAHVKNIIYRDNYKPETLQKMSRRQLAELKVPSPSLILDFAKIHNSKRIKYKYPDRIIMDALTNDDYYEKACNDFAEINVNDIEDFKKTTQRLLPKCSPYAWIIHKLDEYRLKFLTIMCSMGSKGQIYSDNSVIFLGYPGNTDCLAQPACSRRVLANGQYVDGKNVVEIAGKKSKADEDTNKESQLSVVMKTSTGRGMSGAGYESALVGYVLGTHGGKWHGHCQHADHVEDYNFQRQGATETKTYGRGVNLNHPYMKKQRFDNDIWLCVSYLCCFPQFKQLMNYWNVRKAKND